VPHSKLASFPLQEVLGLRAAARVEVIQARGAELLEYQSFYPNLWARVREEK
jgi:hypothetical protein